MKKIPLLDLVVATGLEEGRARALIMAGRVRINAQVETRVNRPVQPDVTLDIDDEKKLPSRAGEKLRGALELFKISVKDRVCIDLGAAHGGFSTVLLAGGARRVYAVDVAYGLLDYHLRNEPRVVVLERRNARYISGEWFEVDDLKSPEGFFVVCDLSFISLKTILNSLQSLAAEMPGPLEGIFLIKPQFEASHLTEGGVIRDEKIRATILDEVLRYADNLGYSTIEVAPAVISGMAGNVEYTAHLVYESD